MANFFKNPNPRLVLSLTLFVLVAGFVLVVRIRHENKYEEALQQLELSQVESIRIYSWHEFCEDKETELSEEDKIELISLLNQVEMVGDNVSTDLNCEKHLMFHIKLKDGMEFDFAANSIYMINITLGYQPANRKVSRAINKQYLEWAEKYFPFPSERAMPW